MLSTLDQAAAKLREIPCPRCLHLGSLAIMHCGPEPGDCDYFGNCSNCGYIFDIAWAETALARVWREAQELVRVDPCPGCGSHDFDVHFACDWRKHACFFVAACLGCGRTCKIPVRP